METPAWAQRPPKTILLATDLSCRSDRAMDRAAHLSRLWKARLVVLTVLEPNAQAMLDRDDVDDLPSWRRPPDRDSAARAYLVRDLPETVQDVEVLFREGVPAAVIVAAAKELGAELIITGVARDEPFGRQVIGATVERLVRTSCAPVLIVRSRFRPYGEVLVATDFSVSSGHALTAASQFFPDARLTGLYAWEVPYAGLLGNGPFSEQWREMEQRAREEFLAKVDLPPAQKRRLQVLTERGQPEILVRAYMLDKQVDLVVIGSHGGGGVFERLIGGVAKRILHAAPGDVLVIREPKAATSR
ncbi:universal stress protein [Phenylobacterium sp. LjRoot219]|uniref:universal stress protein n=1 Tax=Phenylobacterium sp. LjRoot219 TaxID=3342283 RepID=UPI003ED05A0E